MKKLNFFKLLKLLMITDTLKQFQELSALAFTLHGLMLKDGEYPIKNDATFGSIANAFVAITNAVHFNMDNENSDLSIHFMDGDELFLKWQAAEKKTVYEDLINLCMAVSSESISKLEEDQILKRKICASGVAMAAKRIARLSIMREMILDKYNSDGCLAC